MNEENWHELRKKVMYAKDIDEEIEAWEEINLELKRMKKIRKIFEEFEDTNMTVYTFGDKIIEVLADE